jgi:hypothetical protein
MQTAIMAKHGAMHTKATNPYLINDGIILKPNLSEKISILSAISFPRSLN